MRGCRGEAKSAEGLREKTRKGRAGCKRRGSKPPEPPKAAEKNHHWVQPNLRIYDVYNGSQQVWVDWEDLTFDSLLPVQTLALTFCDPN